MRRVTIVLLIILVVGIVTGVIILTYSRSEISYVYDHQSTTPTALSVKGFTAQVLTRRK